MKLRIAALSGALLLAANPPSFAHIAGPPGWGDPPGGSSGQIQWNNSGSFAGITGSNVTSGGAVTLDPTSGVALTLEPASGSDALDAAGDITVGVQDTTQGILTLTGPASGSYGGELVVNNSGSSGAPSFTLFNGTWFQGGGAVPTFRPNTTNDDIALDLSGNGSTMAVWIDACPTDVPADAAAHGGTLQNYTCGHFEEDANGNLQIYSNILSGGAFQTPGTLTLNQQPNGSPSPSYGPVGIPGGLTVGHGLADTGNVTVSSGTLAVTAPSAATDGISITGTNGPAYTLTDGTHPLYIGLATTAGYYTAQTAAGDAAIFAGVAGTSSNALHISAQSNQNDNIVFTTNGDVEVGTGSAIATSATGGFFALATMNGVPTGTPANHATGFAHCVVDYSDSKLECYYNGGWNHLAFAAGT